MAATLFCLTYDKWFLDRMGDWDYESREEVFLNEKIRNMVAERRVQEKKISVNSVKCFTRVVTEEEYKRICGEYD